MKKKNASELKKDAKQTLYLIIILLTITSLAFKYLNKAHLEQTSLLFVGIPALLSLLMIKYAKKPKSAYSTVFFVITMFLLISGMFLDEGVICILMMAPIFYLVGAVCVALYQLINHYFNNRLNTLLVLPALLLIGQANEFGKTPATNSVVTELIVPGTISLDSFNKTPDFMQDLPTFLRLGFPKPIAIEGDGIAVGDRRSISFKSTTKGIGTLTLEVSKRTKNTVDFTIVEDSSHIAHWMSWKGIRVRLEPMEGQQTRIVWTSDFTCDLGPSWYFKALEKYAVDLMNAHLIRAYF